MPLIPGKSLAPQYTVTKSNYNTFLGSKVVGIAFSVTPTIDLTPLQPFVIKVLAIKQDGSTQDVTDLSTLTIDSPSLVQLYPSGVLIANTTGLTTLRASFQGFAIDEPVVIISGTTIWTYFRWTMTGLSQDFTVTLPAAQANDTYAILGQLVKSSNVAGLYLPDVIAGDRTITTFRVITTSNLSIGDKIDFLIYI